MKLTDLEPEFIRYEKRPDGDFIVQVQTLAEATGLKFLCPKCFVENKGPIRTHIVICWNPSVPQSIGPKPGRWNLVGTGFHDLSLVAGSSSVQLLGGCNWHGFVTKGEVT